MLRTSRKSRCCTGGPRAARRLRSTCSSRISSKEGFAWKDVPVAGGGGDAAMTALKAMVAAGNPPTASQMLGYIVLDYAEAGKLGDITETRDKGRLGQGRSGGAAEVHDHDGKWVAVSGQRPLGQLAVDQQGGDGQDRRHRAQDLRRFHRAARQGQGGGRHSAGARRPALAGSHHVRLGRAVDRRHRLLQEGVHRPRRELP